MRLNPGGPRAARAWAPLWATMCVLFVFATTLRLPYAFDDLDVIGEAALYASGAQSLTDLLVKPHNEHTIPLFRVLVWGAIRVFGLDARPLRLLLIALHLVGAWACARLVARDNPDGLGPWVAATLYAAAGFAGSVLWCPTCSVFLLATVPLWLALLLVYGKTLSIARFAAVIALLVLSCAGTSVALPLLLSAVLAVWLLPRRSRVPPWVATLAIFMVGLTVLIIARSSYARFSGIPFPMPALRPASVLNGLWVAFTAPGKLVLSGRTLTPSRVSAAAGLAWIPLLLGLRWLTPQSRRLLIACWAGPVALTAAIGLARGDSGREVLLSNDRYYYLFAAPLAVHIGLLVSALRLRVAGIRLRTLDVAIVALALAYVAMARVALNSTVLWVFFEKHASGWSRLHGLGLLIAEEAAHPPHPWVLVDGRIPAAGMHKESLPLRALLYGMYPGGLPGVTFAGQAGPPDRARINGVLRRWRVAVGSGAPVLCAVGESLVSERGNVVDFRSASYDDAVLSGFFAWDGLARWMGPQASLRLPAGAGDLVVRAFTMAGALRSARGVPGVRVDVAVDEVPVGSWLLAQDGEQEARFAVSPPLDPQRYGQPVTLSLKASPAWRPIEILPANRDPRELTVAVMAAAFSTGTLAEVTTSECPVE